MVTADDMDNYEANLVISDSTIEGTVRGIPSGVDRLFILSVYDANDTLQFQGRIAATLPKGANVNIPMTLYPVNTSTTISGNIIAFGDPLQIDGLVAYYPFNGNVLDISGNGFNGTNIGVMPTADRFGNENRAYYFDGENDWIKLPETFFHSDIEAFSVSLWYLASGDSYEAPGLILYKSANNGEFQVKTENDSLKFGVKLNIYEDPQTKVDLNRSDGWYLAQSPLIANKFTHIACVYKKGTSISLIIDNTVRITTDIPAFDLFEKTNFFSSIGTYNQSSQNSWQGTIDDIRIFNRALTDEEIGQLYSEGQ